MADSPNPENEGIIHLLQAGAEIAGGVAGAAIGLVVAGPPGALIGGAGGPLLTSALKRLGAEIHKRMLGPREEQRIGGVVAFAVERIKEKLDRGEQPRSDGFFESQFGSRPVAEEVFEGVLLAAQREHEERKLRYMGNLIANLAFHPEIDRGYANYLIRLAEDLSYRQLCLLFLFALQDKSTLRQSDYRASSGNFSPALIGILQEAGDLDTQGLISSGSAAFGPTDINPGKSQTQGAGYHLFDLMELGTIPVGDVQAVANVLT